MSEKVENHPAGSRNDEEFYHNDFDHEEFGLVI
jgi:hypothetical protein